MPSLAGQRLLGRHFGDNLGEGNCESINVSRRWGDNFRRETSRYLAGPSGSTTKSLSIKLRLCFDVMLVLHDFHIESPNSVNNNRDRRNHDSQRRHKIPHFFHRPEIGQFSVNFGALPLKKYKKLKLHTKLARERTTPNLKAKKSIPVFWATFSPVRRGLLPVVRDFFCIIPTEQVLYYRNLGLYYGLASGTLPLYSGPCLGVKGGCVSCEKPWRKWKIIHWRKFQTKTI